MSYQAVQTRRFARQYKKLHDNVAADVDAAVSAVETSPKIGDQKKGDLAALYVYKFRSQGQLYLLGYTIGEELKFVSSYRIQIKGMQNMQKKGRKDTKKAAIVMKVADLAGVSTDYVYKVLRGDRDNEKIMTAYFEIEHGENLLVQEVRRVVGF